MPNLLKNIVPDKSDTILLLGIVSLTFGIHSIYSPASYIVLGIILISIAYITAKPPTHNTTEVGR